jgi:hypothetical protein
MIISHPRSASRLFDFVYHVQYVASGLQEYPAESLVIGANAMRFSSMLFDHIFLQCYAICFFGDLFLDRH